MFKKNSYLCKEVLRPKLLVACRLHGALTFRTRHHVPYPDIVTSTIQAQPACLTAIGGGMSPITPPTTMF